MEGSGLRTRRRMAPSPGKITADGERIGQYSYIDNDGKTITVKYTAGKDGFRILEGDHVPRGATGLESAAFDPEVAAQGSLFP